MGRRRCAICDQTNQTTRICRKCKTGEDKKYNVDWVPARYDEFPDDNIDDSENATATSDADAEPGPYENALALEIMRLHCIGIEPKGIADTLSISFQWVYEVIAHWNENHGYTVSLLRDHLSKKDAVDIVSVLMNTFSS